ncbi:MAG: zinc ribbon domain-containing protein [Nitrospirota bacterium]|nr:zinc ribbon domain-containing protein [Nitrospirota bacterium]
MEILFLWVTLSVASGFIARNKGRSFLGFCLLSVILSPAIGIIAALVASPNTAAIEARQLSSDTMQKCPACAELVRVDATICRYCSRNLHGQGARA